MSIEVQNQVWKLDLPPNLKYVAIALADHAHDDGTEARPSQQYLAKKTGLSVRHVRRCLRELIERGVIRIDRPSAKGRATCYAFVLGGQPRPVKGNVGRSSESLGRSSTTVWAVTHDPLIIKNPHIEKSVSSTVSEVVSDEARRQALADIRASLRGRR